MGRGVRCVSSDLLISHFQRQLLQAVSSETEQRVEVMQRQRDEERAVCLGAPAERRCPWRVVGEPLVGSAG